MNYLNDALKPTIGSTYEPLNASNYNEIDAMVISQLTYIELEEIPGYENQSFCTGEGMSLEELADMVLTNKSICKSETCKLLQTLSTNPRYKDIKISNFACKENADTQWAGLTVNLGDDTSVVAFRGTNGTNTGWEEDFKLSFQVTEAQTASAEYLRNCDADKIIVTGHSKGGNDAIAGYMLSDESVRSKIVHIDNLDGPGPMKTLIEANPEAYRELNDKLTSYYPEDSVVGQIANKNMGETIYVKADALNDKGETSIFNEHDLLNWHIRADKKGLEICEQSFISKLIENIMDSVDDNVSMEERQYIVGMLIEMNVTGLLADSNMNEINPDGIVRLIHSLEDPERRETVIKLLFIAVVSLSKTLYNDDYTENIRMLLDAICAAYLTVILVIPIAILVDIIMDIEKLIHELVDFVITSMKKLCDWISNAWKRIKAKYDGTNEPSEIEVSITGLVEVSNNYGEIGRMLNTYIDEIDDISKRVPVALGTVKTNLFAARTYAVISMDVAKHICESVETIAVKYMNAEMNVMRMY